MTATMMLVVTGVGFLIHLYSSEYMKDDPGYYRFFAYLNLFIFSMLVLILGDSLPMLFVGWEGVGLCSYLLIGFWFTEEKNDSAGKKAFIVNRIGDFGLLCAMCHAGLLHGLAQLGRHRRERRQPAAAREDLADRQPLARDAAGLPRQRARAEQARARVRLDAVRLRAVPRLRRQERADPALRLAARRHGRPDAGLRPDPRGHDGHGRRLPRRAHVRRLRPVAGGDGRRRDRRRGHRDLRGEHGLLPARPEEGARLLHGEPARLHVHRRGRRRVHGRLLPRVHARLLQGLPVPRRRLGDPRDARAHPRHRRSQDMRNMGGLRKFMPITHATYLVSCLSIAGVPLFAGFWSKDEILWKASRPVGRTVPPPGSWRGRSCGLARVARPGHLLGRHLRRHDDRVLHVPRLLPDVPRVFRGWKIVQGWKDPSPGHDDTARRPRARSPREAGRDGRAGAARVAAADDRAADGARRLRAGRWLPGRGADPRRAAHAQARADLRPGEHVRRPTGGRRGARRADVDDDGPGRRRLRRRLLRGLRHLQAAGRRARAQLQAVDAGALQAHPRQVAHRRALRRDRGGHGRRARGHLHDGRQVDRRWDHRSAHGRWSASSARCSA
ncbi:MAG: hypothetical protein IPM79_02175 [Polyangiaceae bacterium]|nr:hypothetical protein [Polyangiaceae bacterium]